MNFYVEFDRGKRKCRTVSIEEAAEIWGFSRQTVYNSVKTGDINVVRISDKRMRISLTEIERVLKGAVQ